MGVACQDDDPYVRKTAAVCVAKLHDINSTLVEDQGFLDLLKDLLSDSVPMVTTVIYSCILVGVAAVLLGGC